MSALKWVFKDPDEIEDFVLDWTARLQPSDAIAASTWIAPAGIIVNSETFTNNGSYWNGTATVTGRYWTTIWLSGGTLGETYEFVNRIMTTGARTYDQTVKLKVKTR